MLAKIAQFNFQPQGGHLHIFKTETLLLIYTMISCIMTNLPEFILHSMLEPREQLTFPCLLSKVFAFYTVDLFHLLKKQGIGSATVNRMFVPKIEMERLLQRKMQH